MILDHIDLRVPNLSAVRPFYAVLLPALGLTRDVSNDTWFQFEAAPLQAPDNSSGITESPPHVPNETRIAFWTRTRTKWIASPTSCIAPGHDK